jgi:hypothetical protein
LGGGQHHDQVAVLGDVAQLGGLMTGVERDDHRAEVGDAEEPLGVLDGVRREQADAVPAAHAERVQPAGDVSRPLPQLGE